MKQLDSFRVGQEIEDIFGSDHLIASFLTGGVAAETAGDSSDIDIFVCHDGTPTEDDISTFREFYFELHDELEREPDCVSPGEVMSESLLLAGLIKVIEMEPAKSIASPQDFDYICWAGMLVSKKVLYTPQSIKLKEFETLAETGVTKWMQSLFGGMEYTTGTGELTDSDKILARAMSCPGYYSAHI